jgi:enediyne biosynthesis protein E4
LLQRIFILSFYFLISGSLFSQPLFTKLDAAYSGVKFTNIIKESDSLHIMNYEYLYNGHGTGVADFNNDGLSDLFFSGNMVSSRLFINLGNCKFKDVTEEAGITFNGTWATGVSIADVNGDGKPDIYVCHSGKFPDSSKLSNQLYVLQNVKDGVPHFKEMAKDFGIDAPGTQTTQAAFFDYDRDGDLDMFLLNHSNHTYNPLLNTRAVRSTPDMRFGNRLFRNDRDKNGNIHFTDVTLSAGIVNNALNFGLSVGVSDINNDGWPDIYTTSDYTEKDCFYINQRNGTFKESLSSSFAHISKYSMGSDIADYNNDLRPDILTLDMLPEDNHRQKLLKGPDEYDQYHLLLDSGYYHQQMRNMLQLNEGIDDKGNLRFSEIGQLAGVSNTDWSWAGLFADLDNDGWKDLFITNGYLRDFTDLDFLKYTVSNAQLEEAKKKNFNFKTFALVKKMPSNKVSSYAFHNSGDLTFSNVTAAWGLNESAVSSGAAYADLDNDGDLVLIVCRNNEPVFIYRNSASEKKDAHYCKIRLNGIGANTAALGAKVYLYCQAAVQMQEKYPVRGYQSTVTDELFFGLGKSTTIDSLVIRWPDMKETHVGQLKADSTYTFDQSSANGSNRPMPPVQRQFTDITSSTGIDFIHKENDFIDFKDEVLLPYQLSKEGPALAKGDVNGDGLQDIYVGGAIEQAGVLFIQTPQHNFIRTSDQPWNEDAVDEDVNALFFDADGDKDLDLYVVSGGNEYADGSPEYQDRLYINDGKGNFSRAPNSLPAMLSSKQAVTAGDFDHDGDLDLFVGGRVIPGSFPFAPRSYILRNESTPGNIKFTDVTASVCEALLQPGMVTVAAWSDLNNDGFPELMIGGDWMPIKLFQNNSGKLSDHSAKAGLSNTSGMWSSLLATDVDGDGDTDFIAGNVGGNQQFKASVDKPMQMYAADFDGNGSIDPLICYYIQNKSYPMASRDELLEQVVSLRKKFVYYKDYADAQAENIFDKQKLESAPVLTCELLESGVFINNGNMNFTFQPFPVQAQFSRVNGIVTGDFNKDSVQDIILAGNFFPNRVQSGRNDASLGILLTGTPSHHFSPVDPSQSGLYIGNDVRHIELIQISPGEYYLVVANNNDKVEVEKIK